MSKEHESGGCSSGAGSKADPCGSRYAWTGDGPLSTEIVRAVAEATGTHPTDLDATLAGRVDTDALDELFEPAADAPDPTRRGVWFDFADHRVVVYGDGEIEVRRPTPSAAADARRTGHPEDDRSEVPDDCRPPDRSRTS